MVQTNAQDLDHARSKVPEGDRERRPPLILASDERETVRLLACPACGGTCHRFLYTKNKCDIVRCEDCGLGRTLTSSFDPNDYYTVDYFSGKRSDGYADYLGAEPVLRREFAGTVQFIRNFRRSGRLLEVGCAYGFLLQVAQRDFEVTSKSRCAT